VRQKYHSELAFARGKGNRRPGVHERAPIFVENASVAQVPQVREATVQPWPRLSAPPGPWSAQHQCQTNVNFPLKSEETGTGQSGHRTHAVWGLPSEQMRAGMSSPQMLPPCLLQPSAGCTSGFLRRSCFQQCHRRMPQGICILDASGRVIQINKSIEKLQGRGAEEILGRSPAVLFRDPSDFDALQEKVRTTGRRSSATPAGECPGPGVPGGCSPGAPG